MGMKLRALRTLVVVLGTDFGVALEEDILSG